MTPSAAISRDNLVRRGQRLEYFTVVYNSVEGLVSIVAGLISGSVSLVGFGLDSVIEVTSGAALLWRLHHDLNPSRREQVERTTLRIVGWSFMALAAYILYESCSTLIRHEAPMRSILGIIVAAISVVVMPLLARAKRQVAAELGSGAMRADSRQTDFCAYLSAILLGGFSTYGSQTMPMIRSFSSRAYGVLRRDCRTCAHRLTNAHAKRRRLLPTYLLSPQIRSENRFPRNFLSLRAIPFPIKNP
jgi:divalent metal cation (Fe/Co/Zn/Cd) transporter